MSKRKNTTGIPDFEIESIARSFIPGLLKFYSSEEGKKEYEKYKQSQADNKPKNLKKGA